MADAASERTSPWGETLQEANEMGERLRADGWEVVTVRAGHVAPFPPDRGDADRSGLVFVAPDDVADGLRAAVDGADLTDYEVFRRQVGSDLFVLVRLTDADARVAVLLVGAVDLATAGPLREAARERGVLYSHVRLLDGTHLAIFRHDDPTAVFPSPS